VNGVPTQKVKDMAFKAAFIFVAPEVSSTKHRAIINTPSVELSVVGVGSYAEAEKVAAELVEQGVGAFELCAGFGVEGVARIKKVVGNKGVVGVVRFDQHPGLGGKSGDELF
jgi:hypothetical protein